MNPAEFVRMQRSCLSNAREVTDGLQQIGKENCITDIGYRRALERANKAAVRLVAATAEMLKEFPDD